MAAENPTTIQCACGCAQTLTALDAKGRPRKFINGHQTKTLVWKRKRPYACPGPNKGRKASAETRERLRLSHLGKTPWNARPDPNPSRVCLCGCLGRTARRRRYLPGHHVRKNFAAPIKVDKASGCWVWQRGRNDRGYGQVAVGGKQLYAHRVYYERAKGPIPEGLVLDHLCCNPPCVNPDHLEAVTQRVNVHRARQNSETHE